MKKQIEKLTEAQTDLFPSYVKKWIDIGTNTDRLNVESCTKTINNFRKMIAMEEVPLIIVDNPIEAWVACCLHEAGVKNDDLLFEMKTVFHGNPKKYDIPKGEMPYQSGSFFASVFSFYDYMIEELDIPLDAELYAKYKVWEKTCDVGCIYPLDKLTILTQKPTIIHLNENNVLHKDGAAALEYAGEGDFKIYALNGVMVPEYLAVTPEENLDIELYLKEKNADVKAEFVRKAGIERFLSYGTLMDSYKNYDKKIHKFWHSSEYELYDMQKLFDGLESAPYLKMKNPTVDIYHLEGVSPDCQTVEAAVKQRFMGRDFVIEDMA
jgi:hypothetical protein